MAGEERRARRSEVRHSIRFGNICKCRAEFHEVQTGTRKRKGKDKDAEPEPVYERFWSQTPFGYRMDYLRPLMKDAVRRVTSGETKKVELNLLRYPQVHTVMGELVAQMPKAQRVRFGYTTKEEENTLFVIEKAA
jgi:hypothetical protein